jgi:hypothetical protein
LNVSTTSVIHTVGTTIAAGTQQADAGITVLAEFNMIQKNHYKLLGNRVKTKYQKVK